MRCHSCCEVHARAYISYLLASKGVFPIRRTGRAVIPPGGVGGCCAGPRSCVASAWTCTLRAASKLANTVSSTSLPISSAGPDRACPHRPGVGFQCQGAPIQRPAAVTRHAGRGSPASSAACTLSGPAPPIMWPTTATSSCHWTRPSTRRSTCAWAGGTRGVAISGPHSRRGQRCTLRTIPASRRSPAIFGAMDLQLPCDRSISLVTVSWPGVT